MLLNWGVGEDSWESLGLQGDPTSPFWRRSALGFLWREWCWSWNSCTLAPWCEDLTHWKRLWCWEGLGAGGEGDDRGWDGWMASLTRWTWVWVNSGSLWWTGRPGVLGFMGSQRVGHDWATELTDWLTDWLGRCFCFLIFHLVLFYWIMVVSILLILRSFYFLSVLILLDFSVASNTSNLSEISFNPLLSSYYLFFLCLPPFWKLSTYCFCFPAPTEYFTFPLPLHTV